VSFLTEDPQQGEAFEIGHFLDRYLTMLVAQKAFAMSGVEQKATHRLTDAGLMA